MAASCKCYVEINRRDTYKMNNKYYCLLCNREITTNYIKSLRQELSEINKQDNLMQDMLEALNKYCEKYRRKDNTIPNTLGNYNLYCDCFEIIQKAKENL